MINLGPRLKVFCPELGWISQKAAQMQKTTSTPSCVDQALTNREQVYIFGEWLDLLVAKLILVQRSTSVCWSNLAGSILAGSILAGSSLVLFSNCWRFFHFVHEQKAETRAKRAKYERDSERREKKGQKKSTFIVQSMPSQDLKSIVPNALKYNILLCLNLILGLFLVRVMCVFSCHVKFVSDRQTFHHPNHWLCFAGLCEREIWQNTASRKLDRTEPDRKTKWFS